MFDSLPRHIAMLDASEARERLAAAEAEVRRWRRVAGLPLTSRLLDEARYRLTLLAAALNRAWLLVRVTARVLADTAAAAW